MFIISPPVFKVNRIWDILLFIIVTQDFKKYNKKILFYRLTKNNCVIHQKYRQMIFKFLFFELFINTRRDTRPRVSAKILGLDAPKSFLFTCRNKIGPSRPNFVSDTPGGVSLRKNPHRMYKLEFIFMERNGN